MHPAFVPTSPFPFRPRPQHGTSCTPRMSVPVPRPGGGMPADGQYQSLRRDEANIAPVFISQLHDAATSPRFEPPAPFATAALRALLGNAHIFDAELAALAPLTTRLAASGDVREFVREVAKSPAFRSRFFHATSSLRFVELCFKHVLARAPANQPEVARSLAVLYDSGYDALVDSLVDSDEYAARFGTTLVPQMAVSGVYHDGMPNFSAQMRLTLATRAGSSDPTFASAVTTSVLAGGNPASPLAIKAAYEVSHPTYEVENWMALPMSTLLTDWAAITLNPAEAAQNWSGLGTPRATGEADAPWEDGWQPKVSGAVGEWTAGWAPKAARRS